MNDVEEMSTILLISPGENLKPEYIMFCQNFYKLLFGLERVSGHVCADYWVQIMDQMST